MALFSASAMFALFILCCFSAAVQRNSQRVIVLAGAGRTASRAAKRSVSG